MILVRLTASAVVLWIFIMFLAYFQDNNQDIITMCISSKKAYICTNCKKQGHSIETCWSKGGGKEGKIAKKLSEKAYSDIWGLSRHLTNDKKLY